MSTLATPLKEIRVPFAGFYESIASEEAERNAFYQWPELSKVADYENIYEPSMLPEDQQSAFYDWYSDNHRQFQLELANTYVSNLFAEIKKDLKIDIQYSDLVIESPREYNFTTDRLFCKVDISKLHELYDKTNATVLSDIIKDSFTSRDGFSSYYDSDIKNWPADIKAWDHNQLATIFEAYIKDYDIEEYELYN